MSNEIELRKMVQSLDRLAHVLKSQTSAILAQNALMRTLVDQQARYLLDFHGGKIHAEGGTASPGGREEDGDVSGGTAPRPRGTGEEQEREREATPT